MPRVLFTHSYFMRLDPKQWKQMQPYAPLATITAAAYIRMHGYSVSLFDTMFSHGAEDIIPALEKHRPEYLVIYDDGFNYLTKMCLTNMREAAFKMMEIARNYNCKVILSGSDSTDHFEKYLDKGADVIIIGEGELTLLEVLNAMEEGQEVSAITGTACKTEAGYIKQLPRPVMQTPDQLPMAAWDLVDIAAYKKRWLQKNGYFSVNIATTRGCPYKCNWCAKPIYGNRYNSRSPQHVAEELRYLKQEADFDHVWFCDDIFGLKPGWIGQFASLVKQYHLDFTYKIQSRADILLKDGMLDDLALSGCDTIWMGVESGSQKILDAMDKGITVAQVYEVTGKIKALHMKPAFFLQLGYMGETQEDINLTLKMLKELMPDDIGVSVAYPLPGTKFYENVKKDLEQKANWTHSDDLAMMFRNTYQPAYYRLLHRYIHKTYRKQQAWQALTGLLKFQYTFTGQRLYKAATYAWYLPAGAIAYQRLNFAVK